LLHKQNLVEDDAIAASQEDYRSSPSNQKPGQIFSQIHNLPGNLVMAQNPHILVQLTLITAVINSSLHLV